MSKYNCGLCHSVVAINERLARCVACGTICHEECVEELGGGACPAAGCEGRAFARGEAVLPAVPEVPGSGPPGSRGRKRSSSDRSSLSVEGGGRSVPPRRGGRIEIKAGAVVDAAPAIDRAERPGERVRHDRVTRGERSDNLVASAGPTFSLESSDLSGSDLRGQSLGGRNLSEANLTGARMEGANLRSALLAGADLTEADLTEADLTAATLERAVLRRATLVRANLRGVGARAADLSDADLTGADLSHAGLREASLHSACLARATLEGASLGRRTPGERARSGILMLVILGLMAATVHGLFGKFPLGLLLPLVLVIALASRWTDKLTGEQRPADLTRSDLQSACLRDASLYAGQLAGSNLLNADLRGADLRKADLTAADLRGANLSSARMAGAILTGASVEGVTLEGASGVDLARTVGEPTED